MEEYGRRNKNPATESQNKPETRNATTRADNHSCLRRSSGSGGEGHTSEGRTNDRAQKEGRGSTNSDTVNGETKNGEATRSTGP